MVFERSGDKTDLVQNQIYIKESMLKFQRKKYMERLSVVPLGDQRKFMHKCITDPCMLSLDADTPAFGYNIAL